jgi:hypothetical protein
MLILKPYGRSATSDTNGQRQRTLTLTADLGKAEIPGKDIAGFASTNPEILINQWISVIDRIASKPRNKAGATTGQRQLREQLGKAAFAKLKQIKLVDDSLTLLWNSKVRPYGDAKWKQPRNNPNAKPPESKGRFYKAFVGDCAPAQVTDKIAQAVAEKIWQHLLERQVRRQDGQPVKKRGLIEDRAKSISGNVHAFAAPEASAWSEPDWTGYIEPKNIKDIAANIFKAASEAEPKNLNRRLAGTKLYEHYARVFVKTDGVVMTLDEARDAMPGGFALHQQVKETYKLLFERLAKAGAAQKIRTSKKSEHELVKEILPADAARLKTLLCQKKGNQDLARLVRLGKVIHYEACLNSLDAQELLWEKFPDKDTIEKSRYWLSDGQTEIKRNEALVRIWRGVIAQAQRVLSDWADPENKLGDIFDHNESIVPVTGANFKESDFDAKAKLLFGPQRIANLTTTPDKQAILKQALNGWRTLRNNSFHFKGRQGFINTLENKPEAGATPFINQLWTADQLALRERVKAELEAAHAPDFLTHDQLQQVVPLVETLNADPAPLPRFNRTLHRAKHAWKGKDTLGLPFTVNRDDMEKQPARRMQYLLLKLIYERAFPAWMGDQKTDTLNGWIGKAQDRADAAAKHINTSAARARVRLVGALAPRQKFADFLKRLAAMVASENRIQRGYEPDPETARDNADFLNDIQLDVVAQGFRNFLDVQKLQWLRKFDITAERPAPPTSTLAEIKFADAKPDQTLPSVQCFYFLLHMVPIEEASKLLHQLRKWQVLEEKGGGSPTAPACEIKSVMEALALYLAMHDAKYDGGKPLTELQPFKSLYEDPTDFDRLFHNATDPDKDRHVPVRGLREMLRFGGRASLMQLFTAYKVPHSDVQQLLQDEVVENGTSVIAAAQKKRENLHAQWVKQMKLEGDDLTNYIASLRTVTEHRHRAAAVRLTNFVRTHRLMMQVLGRLVDYAGLWERDLYFVLLALVHDAKSDLKTCFSRNNPFKNKFTHALDELDKAPSPITKNLKSIFGLCGFTGKDFLVRTRNDIDHFNMLRGGATPNLSDAANRVRDLMAYDRKLKNAVAPSLIELLEREGLHLVWKMSTDHQLTDAQLVTKQAEHLGSDEIKEALHDSHFLRLIAALFGGTATNRSAVYEKKPPQKGVRNGQHENKNGRNQSKQRQNPPFSHGKGRET